MICGGTYTTTAKLPVTLSDLKQLPDGAFQFGYMDNGVSYAVHASTNLFNWEPVGAATETAPGRYQFTDLAATNLPRRFYQLRWP